MKPAITFSLTLVCLLLLCSESQAQFRNCPTGQCPNVRSVQYAAPVVQYAPVAVTQVAPLRQAGTVTYASFQSGSVCTPLDASGFWSHPDPIAVHLSKSHGGAPSGMSDYEMEVYHTRLHRSERYGTPSPIASSNTTYYASAPVTYSYRATGPFRGGLFRGGLLRRLFGGFGCL